METFKNPNELGNNLINEDDEFDGLEDFIDEFYGDRYVDLWTSPSGYDVTYNRPEYADKRQYQFMVSKGDESIDSWDEYIPVKKSLPQFRQLLTERIKNAIKGVK